MVELNLKQGLHAVRLPTGLQGNVVSPGVNELHADLGPNMQARRRAGREIHCSGLLPKDFAEDSHWKCGPFGFVTV
jgi:hypothetical protein